MGPARPAARMANNTTDILLRSQAIYKKWVAGAGVGWVLSHASRAASARPATCPTIECRVNGQRAAPAFHGPYRRRPCAASAAADRTLATTAALPQVREV